MEQENREEGWTGEEGQRMEGEGSVVGKAEKGL